MADATKINDRGGALSALANYWLTRFNYEKDGEARAVPEFNLETGGSAEPFAHWLEERDVASERTGDVAIGFEAGLHFAAVLSRDFMRGESELQAALQNCLEYLSPVANPVCEEPK